MNKYEKKFVGAMTASTLVVGGLLLFVNSVVSGWVRYLNIGMAIVLLYLIKNSWWKVYELKEKGLEVTKENILDTQIINQTIEGAK